MKRNAENVSEIVTIGFRSDKVDDKVALVFLSQFVSLVMNE